MSLTFDELKRRNVQRCEEGFKHRVDDWSPTDWGCAWAGEVGEALNLIKKLRQGREVPLSDIADEIADAVIYADLLATRMGIDLGEAVRSKFNAVSQRVGSRVLLAGPAAAATECGKQ